MKFKKEAITRTFGKLTGKIKKHSPEILIGAGITGSVVAAVMACKETTKAQAIKDELKKDIDTIHDVASMDRDDYTEKDEKKDITLVYTKAALKFVKLYAPSVLVGVTSIASILAGYKIIKKRNLALAAAYTTISTSFKEYRGRVAEKFGDAAEKEIRYGIKSQEIEEKTTDSKGKEKTVKKTVDVIDPNTISDYAKIYDDGCTGWTKDPELNLCFLKKQQDWANERLKAKGHLYLNEVYDMLGIPRTKAGQVVGWVYDEKNPVGDNYVDFGIYDMNNPRTADFVNGYERSILLDFNVDGNILDMM